MESSDSRASGETMLERRADSSKNVPTTANQLFGGIDEVAESTTTMMAPVRDESDLRKPNTGAYVEELDNQPEERS